MTSSFPYRGKLRRKSHAPGLYLSTCHSPRAQEWPLKINSPYRLHNQGLALMLSTLTTMHAMLAKKPKTRSLLSIQLRWTGMRTQPKVQGRLAERPQKARPSCQDSLGPPTHLRLRPLCPILCHPSVITLCIRTALLLLRGLLSAQRPVWITWTSSVSKIQPRRLTPAKTRSRPRRAVFPRVQPVSKVCFFYQMFASV